MIKSIGMKKYEILNTNTKYLNQIFNSKSGAFKVIGIYGRDKRGDSLYICEFLNTGFQTLASSGNLIAGRLKDLYVPVVCGVGYIGDCSSENIKSGNYHYKIWEKMLERCYDLKYQKNQKSYKGCYVCDEWHNLGVFSEEQKNLLGYKEMIDNPSIKFHMDKDILEHGNKIYCFEKCCYIPYKINIFFANKKSKNNTNLPTGVCLCKNGDIKATAFFNNKKIHLGYFKNTQKEINEAQTFYWNKKLEIANIYLQEYDFLDIKIKKAIIEKVFSQAKDDGIIL